MKAGDLFYKNDTIYIVFYVSILKITPMDHEWILAFNKKDKLYLGNYSKFIETKKIPIIVNIIQEFLRD